MIEAEKKSGSFVILSLHLGRQMQADLRENELRYFKSCLPDLVVLHHPHLSFESDNNIHVLGDFIFSNPSSLNIKRSAKILSLNNAKKKIINLEIRNGLPHIV